jgi:hypothetical protein
MTTEPSPAVPESQDWLETSIKYEGQGKAEFTDPPGVVEGPAVVRVNPHGEQSVTIDVTNPPPAGPFFYIKGSVLATDFRRHGTFNPCASVSVKAQSGVYTATERVLYEGGMTRTKPHQVRLRPLRGHYEAADTAEVAYWALPLSNFILRRWPRPVEGLGAHALRIFLPRFLSADLRGQAREQAQHQLREHQRLVIFEVNGQPGFIERIPDYEKTVHRLQRGRTANAITVIMVGPAHVPCVRFSDYQALFPLDVVALLTLATGVRVGAPWVEFRDASGRLVRRVHIPFGAPAYEHGHAALPNFIPEALGEMLTAVFKSPERGQSYLRVVTNLAIDTSLRRQTLESRFINLVRAFETLCQHHGLAAQNLMANLETSQQVTVQAVLRAASSQVTSLGRVASDPARARTLDRIASRVASAAQKENDFGLAIVELLRRFKMPDADVLQPYLAAHPVAGAHNWPSLLSFLRGSVAHEAYFDLPSGRHDLYEVSTVLDHLHDVLLRIIFKSLGYAGPYQPPLVPVGRPASVDWVTAAIPLAMLGYY